MKIVEIFFNGKNMSQKKAGAAITMRNTKSYATFPKK